MRLHTALSGAALAVLVLAGCSGDDDVPAAADGEPERDEPVADDSGDPMSLSLASSYGTLVYTPAVEFFVERVDEISGGELTVQVLYDFGDDRAGAAEQEVVAAVADGDVELAWVGTRVFDTVGVSSFQALHAPFLVDSYQLQGAIIDSDIPDRMLSGLDDIAVTGLAVFAGGLRIPVGVDGPLLEPDDFAGITFQYFRSDAQGASVTALGATPTDLTAQRDDGLASGEIDAHEHSLLTYVQRGNYTLAPYLSANTILWPETQALIINPDVLASLTDTQAGWLHDAAADAAGRSAELHDVDTDLAVEACERGARFAEASEAQLAALREAVEPVYAELSADPLTAELIAEIEALKQTVTAEPLAIPEGCTGDAPGRTEAAVAEGTDDPSVLNGTYRLEWTFDELLESMSQWDPEPESGARSNAGVIALTFDNGDFDQVWESGQSQGDSCPGTYAVTGDRVVMVANVEGRWDCDPDTRGVLLVDAAWELTDDQLILSDFVLSDEPDITWWNEFFLGTKPFTRAD